MIHTTTIQSSAGKQVLLSVNYQHPAQESAWAVVQIVHGMAEHSGRYNEFMEFLANQGVVVVIHDQIGHGKSRWPNKPLTYLGPTNGWEHLQTDILRVKTQLIDKNWPQLPVFVLGHSMGSMLVRSLLQQPLPYQGIILSGTTHDPGLLLRLGKGLSFIGSKLKGADKKAPFMNTLSFGAYNKAIQSPQTPFDWLSRDTERVDDYIQDPLCGQVACLGFYSELFKGIQQVARIAPHTANQNLPVFLISGDADPVGESGKWVLAAKQQLIQARYSKVEMKLYPGGRHEMLNETNRHEVFDHLLQWLKNTG